MDAGNTRWHPRFANERADPDEELKSCRKCARLYPNRPPFFPTGRYRGHIQPLATCEVCAPRTNKREIIVLRGSAFYLTRAFHAST